MASFTFLTVLPNSLPILSLFWDLGFLLLNLWLCCEKFNVVRCGSVSGNNFQMLKIRKLWNNILRRVNRKWCHLSTLQISWTNHLKPCDREHFHPARPGAMKSPNCINKILCDEAVLIFIHTQNWFSLFKMGKTNTHSVPAIKFCRIYIYERVKKGWLYKKVFPFLKANNICDRYMNSDSSDLNLSENLSGLKL